MQTKSWLTRDSCMALADIATTDAEGLCVAEDMRTGWQATEPEAKLGTV